MKRIEWVDFGKGFTIFLVVVGHVFSGMFQSRSFIENKKFNFYFNSEYVYFSYSCIFSTIRIFI